VSASPYDDLHMDRNYEMGRKPLNLADLPPGVIVVHGMDELKAALLAFAQAKPADKPEQGKAGS
jgi:hypothetical protein